MSVNISEMQYKQFGKCVFLENGKIKLGATVDIGPRIVYFALEGKENIMFEDDIKRFSEPAGDYGTWYAYGGHRLWCSPEINPETYSPDNSSVDYKFENGVLTLTPPPTPFGKAFSIEVEMDPEKPLVKLTHKIKNISNKPSTFAAWSITSLAPGGACFVPLNNKPTGYLPNRAIVLWDYNDIHDKRFTLENYSARLCQDDKAEKPFKVGFNSTDGYAACSLKDQIFVKVFGGYGDVTYPDFGCNFETYTNSLFLECECLGEIKEFAAGETAQISEQWHLSESDIDFSGNMDDIRDKLAKKVKTI